MYKLEFEDEHYTMHLKGLYASRSLAWQAMLKDLDFHGIKPYYYRGWFVDKENKVECVDYGSHSCFYYITKED